jgi:hypothetical protein
MQLERKPRCPLCRENVIMEAGFGKSFMLSLPYQILFHSLPSFATKPPIFCSLELFLLFISHRRYFQCSIKRGTVNANQNQDNIDEELERFLKKNFPREVREKRIENEIIDGVSRFGPNYVHPSQSKDKCEVM